MYIITLMPSDLNRRQFLATAAFAATGIVGASSQVAQASAPESAYTIESTCVRDEPSGAPIDALDAYTGGYVRDGPVTGDGFKWWKLSFNEDGDSGYTTCMAEADGPVTGWVRDGTLRSADFAYPVTGAVLREWREGEHESLDLAADAGRSVYAAQDGAVVVADSVVDSACGRYVVVDHGGGWTTRYCHLRDVFVTEGQSVTKGTEIGTVGYTGDAYEPHVAFQIRDGGTSQPIPGVHGRQFLAMAGVPRHYR